MILDDMTRKLTIRGWLTDNGFDWANGKIVHQVMGFKARPEIETMDVEIETEDDWVVLRAEVIGPDAEMLDRPFGEYDGIPEVFIASDANAIYFGGDHECRNQMWVLRKNIEDYLDFETHKVPMDCYQPVFGQGDCIDGFDCPKFNPCWAGHGNSKWVTVPNKEVPTDPHPPFTTPMNWSSERSKT